MVIKGFLLMAKLSRLPQLIDQLREIGLNVCY